MIFGEGNLGLMGLAGRGRGVAASNSAEAQQFFNRLIFAPSAARQALYSALIDGLVTAGVWAKLDALYVFAAGEAGTSLLNLVQDAFGAQIYIPSTTVTFVADRGWTGTGVNGNISSNFNPSTAGGHFTQNDAMIGAWNRTAGAAANTSILDTRDFAGKIVIYPRYTGDLRVFSINTNGGTDQIAGQTNASGWLTAQRTGATASETGQNGSQLTTSLRSSASLSNSIISFATSVSGSWQVAAGAIGASLTSGQQAALYTGLAAWMTAVGA